MIIHVSITYPQSIAGYIQKTSPLSIHKEEPDKNRNQAMATAGSAASPRKQNWEEFRETVQKVKGELSNKIQSLTGASKEFEEICDVYCKKYKSEEKIKKSQNDLRQMVGGLKDEHAKAVSKDVTVVFVGRTNSGKSTLINALLRDDRLPAGPGITTMCTIEVRPTPDELWSVIDTGSGTILSDKMDKEAVKEYLDALVPDETEKQRKKENITSKSIVLVNCPSDLCNLPEDIVLVDTPGMAEIEDYDQVVADSFKIADLIVAVINLDSPSMKDLAEVLKGTKAQFKFGVVTKCDTVPPGTKRQQAKKTCKARFENMVEGEKEVYFVEAKNATIAMEKTERNTGIEEFLRFERDLAERAKSVKAQKGISLIKEAEKFSSTFAENLQNFQRTINCEKKPKKERLTSLENKISTLKKHRDFLDKVDQEVNRLDELIRDYLSSENINGLLIELGNRMTECNSEESEDLAINAFFKSKICVINVILNRQILKIKAEFREWEDSIQGNYGCSKRLPPYEAKQLKVPEDYGYNSNWDPHAYITSDNLWGVVFGCATTTGTAAATVMASKAGAATAIVATLKWVGISVTGKALGVDLGVGKKIRSVIGPSQMKKGKIEEHVRTMLEELKAQFEKFQVHASDVMNERSEAVSSHIERVENDSSEEMSTLKGELQQLQTWSQKLREITDLLQVVRKEITELKHGLIVNDTVPSDDQTENQSSV